MDLPKCERCGEAPRPEGHRYCVPCRKAVIKELQAVGYLKPAPQHGTPWRTNDHRENTYETKHGRDG